MILLQQFLVYTEKPSEQSRYHLDNFNIMKLESLELDKFQGDVLKKEQLFELNGAGTDTPGGSRPAEGGRRAYTYGYDSDRGDHVTYHNRIYHK